MPEGSKFAGHVMGAGAGFHDHRASEKGGEEFDQLLTIYLSVEHGFAVLVLTVKMKRVLAQIDSNQCHVLHDGLSRKENTLQRNPRAGWG
ncbi:hypothetical protein BGLT_00948 [Caballeronia glathei]|nr:hypothetical protein BGLT_00948 [Caballeronia glathei]